MVGLVVGLFMFGLVLGSLAMNRRLRLAEKGVRPLFPGMRTMAGLDIAMTVFAAGLVLGLAALRGSVADWAVQAVTFALVAAAGVLGGFVFPLAAVVALETRPGTARAAGLIDAADNAGACLGALVTGVLLVPILGVSGACLAIASMKALSAIFVGAAATVRPGPSPSA
jgi:spermidine synthase